MNKKQLVVAWAVTAILCFVILSAPKKHISNSLIRVFDAPNSVTITTIQWDFVLQRSLVILLIGSLLVYTLRNKKK